MDGARLTETEIEPKDNSPGNVGEADIFLRHRPSPYQPPISALCPRHAKLNQIPPKKTELQTLVLSPCFGIWQHLTAPVREGLPATSVCLGAGSSGTLLVFSRCLSRCLNPAISK